MIGCGSIIMEKNILTFWTMEGIRLFSFILVLEQVIQCGSD